ncbi:Fc.00g035590.m01.CDS01 [Cosmosporella sp. VM-42]
MQAVQRRYGKLRGKATADKASAIALIKDYEDVENAITKIIEDAQTLQRAWYDYSVFQTAIVNGFQELYDPIVGTTDENDGLRPMARTPRHVMDRTNNLYEAYAGLQDELSVEITSIESQLLRPAIEAKDMISPFRVVIKKRDNKRVDYDCAHDKVMKLRRKPNRSPKEDAQLSKAEDDLANLTDEFESADTSLRETLTPLVRATFSLLPPLLATHIIIQNRLLGLCYTVLHEYCIENGFPSPPPGMDLVVAEWDAAFQPVVTTVEGFSSVRKHAALGRKPTAERPVVRRLPSSRQLAAPLGRISSSSSRTDSYQPPTPDETPSPSPSPQLRRNPSGLTVPTDFTTATVLQGRRSTSSSVSLRSDYSAQAAAKKRPPPPPRPGSKPRMQAEFVVAQYDFTGGPGDLSFSEGDMIKIIKKTGTDQDWWEGELHNTKGSFPANYCKPAA